MFRFYALSLTVIASAFASDVKLIEAADSLLPDSKLTAKNLTPYNLTALRYRTNQPFVKIVEIVGLALGSNWEGIEVDASNIELSSKLKASGIDVVSTAQFRNNTCIFQHVVVRYIIMNQDDGFSYTVVINVGHCPDVLRNQAKGPS